MDSMALEKFIPLVTEHPAVFLSLNTSKGKIDIGYDADFVIWNPDQSMIVKEESIYHRHTISPYTGEKLSGVTRVTIVKGVTVYDSGNFIADEIKNGSLLIHE
jgi:allantoinase